MFTVFISFDRLLISIYLKITTRKSYSFVGLSVFLWYQFFLCASCYEAVMVVCVVTCEGENLKWKIIWWLLCVVSVNCISLSPYWFTWMSYCHPPFAVRFRIGRHRESGACVCVCSCLCIEFSIRASLINRKGRISFAHLI